MNGSQFYFQNRDGLHMFGEVMGDVKCSAATYSCGKVIRKGRNRRKSSRIIILSLSTNSWALGLCKVLFLGLLMSSMVATRLCSLEPNITKGTCNIWNNMQKLESYPDFAIFLVGKQTLNLVWITLYFLQVNRHLLLVVIIYTFHAVWEVLWGASRSDPLQSELAHIDST